MDGDVGVTCAAVVAALMDHEGVTVYDIITMLLPWLCVLLPMGCDDCRHVR